MSVYKHPSKKGWQMIKISRGRGKKAKYIPYNGSREEAKIFENEIRGLADRSDPMFRDHLPEFKIAYRNRSSKGGMMTLENSFSHLEPFFGGFLMRHITPLVIEQYKAKRLEDGVKKRTINIELSGLSAYITWINETFGTDFRKPKRFSKRETQAPLPNPLSLEEIAGILENLQGDLRTMVSLMSLCGLRRNEVFYLEAQQVNLHQRTLTIFGKGGKYRNVPYSELLQPALKEACEQRPEGVLFPSPRRGRDPVTRELVERPWTDIRKPINKAAKAAGITRRINPHLFRHSFATALLNGGEDIRIIQELLGHSELATTMIYTQVADKTKRAATDGLAAKMANGNM